MSTPLVLALFFVIYLILMWKAKSNIPIVYLFLFTYFIQYIFSVHLMYAEYPTLGKQMPISHERLFSYLIPAFISLFSGVFLFNRDIDLSSFLKSVNPIEATRLGNLLLTISISVEVLTFFFAGLSSIQSFTVYLRYGALMCYLFNLSIVNILLSASIFLNLFREAILVGIFIEFFVWSTIIFFFVILLYKISFTKRSLFIFVAAPLLIIIQSVKTEYRAYTWKSKRDTGVELLTELAISQRGLEKDLPFAESEGIVRTIGRLNHGWHLAKVLNRVPSKVPFTNGEDMLTDIEGIVLPRILFPGKKLAGDHSKFEYFTGHKIKRTAMTIGVFGDFYINFGTTGSFIGLFLFGALFAKALFWFTQKYVTASPVNIIWIPVLFGYFIRADSDLYTVVNNAFKSFLIFLAVRYVYGLIWNKQLRPTKR
jgi:hypothetical protein